MAVGSVGEYLSFASDYTCTFLSRDGGETWRDIDTCATVFEFGDQATPLCCMTIAHCIMPWPVMVFAYSQSQNDKESETYTLTSWTCSL